MPTRAEHMRWCKQRALEYLEPGEFFSPNDAIASMLSDLGKHQETRDLLDSPAIVALAMESQDETRARRFIEGFN